MNPNPSPASAVVEYEMGYGAAEFGKVLQGPFTGERTDFECAEIARHRWRVTLADQAFAVLIEAEQAPPRKIALFSLPVLKVRFEFEQAEADTRIEFFHRFHQYFHKGGG
jgi:hypothetical protein